jgi:hypothetical protein
LSHFQAVGESLLALASSALDNRTPPEAALAALAGFSRASHIVIDGGAHEDDLFLSSPSIVDAIVRFLRTRRHYSETIVLPKLRFTLP